MIDFTFQEFKELCKRNTDKKYVEDYLIGVDEEDCSFHSGIVGAKENVSMLYNTRLMIAKESNKLSKTEIEDYQICVTNLKKTASEKIGVCSLYTENFSFLIFYGIYNREILGALKLRSLEELSLLEKS